MVLLMIFPHFDPVALHLGPIKIRWYGLAYVVAFLLVQWLGRRRLAHVAGLPTPIMTTTQFDDLIFAAILGVLLGGRCGYMVFYQTSALWHQPLEIFKIWHGGMSFHGGLLGVLTAIFWFSRRNGVALLELLDFAAPLVPIGLFLGRAANFINGELWGRPTHAAWGMIFPWVDQQLRHPSQLYEMLLEGLLLFVVLNILRRFVLRPGFIAGCFSLGYGVIRFGVEYFRQPDVQLGLFFHQTLSMGQLLSLPMIALGCYLVFFRRCEVKEGV